MAAAAPPDYSNSNLPTDDPDSKREDIMHALDYYAHPA